MDPTCYSLYLDADLNRVFTDSLTDIAAAELQIVGRALDCGGEIADIEPISEGRSRRLQFNSDIPVEQLQAIVGQLSASAALFRHHPGGLLEPRPTEEALVFGSELVTTQRYRGKTNERLTRTMLNLALASAGVNPARPTGRLLDPMCGRGTTLNWALAYGMDSIGIEADRTSLDHHGGFLQTWAKRARLPHKMQRHRPGNGEQRHSAFEVAPDRARLKAGEGHRVDTFNADAGDRSLAIKAGSIDVVVCDLPYGIQHRGSGGSGSGSGSGRGTGEGEDPTPETIDLLERVLPTWHRWLRPGGSICLAWNAKRAGRREVSRILATSGYSPVTAPGGHTMRHVVDATIERDVLVATR